MIFRNLSCFSQFHCLAEKCPDTCCAGWEIDLDEATLERYQSISGPLGEQLRAAIQTDGSYTFFALTQDRCPFLNPDGLCMLILALGQDALSITCREHPRFVEEYGNLQETCFSISCPEAARLLLSEPVAFVERETQESAEEDCSLDDALLTELLTCREALLAVLQAQRPLSERIAIIMAAAGEMQSSLGDRAPLRRDNRIESYVFRAENARSSRSALAAYFSRITAPPMTLELSSYLATMTHMEFTSQRLPQLLDVLRSRAVADPVTLFNNVSAPAAQRLLLYFLYRYVLRAVWDGALREKVLLSVYSTAAILALSQTLVQDTHPIRTAASLYSREVEHSDENLDLLYKHLSSYPSS